MITLSSVSSPPSQGCEFIVIDYGLSTKVVDGIEVTELFVIPYLDLAKLDLRTQQRALRMCEEHLKRVNRKPQ